MDKPRPETAAEVLAEEAREREQGYTDPSDWLDRHITMGGWDGFEWDIYHLAHHHAEQKPDTAANRRGVAPPKKKTNYAMAAAGALVQRMVEAEENGEAVKLEEAAQVVLEDWNLLGKVAISTVLTHYRALR